MTTRHLWTLKVRGKDRWVRYRLGTFSGKIEVSIDKWESILGPPSVFTNTDDLKAIASLVPRDVDLDPSLFVVLPPMSAQEIKLQEKARQAAMDRVIEDLGIGPVSAEEKDAIEAEWK